jgi:hypothetical protein
MNDALLTDLECLQFMQALATDQRKGNGLQLETKFEYPFLSSFLMAERQTLWFTPGRKVAIDRLWRKHGPDLNFPHPNDLIRERPRIGDADPDGCEYIVRDERRQQQRCNDPATCREPGQLRYCQAHAEQVKRVCKNIALIPINAEAVRAALARTQSHEI